MFRSSSFTSPCRSTNTFSGFTSRCTIPRSCAAARPSAISIPMWSARAISAAATPPGKYPAERLAFQELHGDPDRAVGQQVGAVHGDDVLVPQPAERDGLLVGALAHLLGARVVREQQLERDPPLRELVDRLVDDADAARADHPHEPVARDGAPRKHRSPAARTSRRRRLACCARPDSSKPPPHQERADHTKKRRGRGDGEPADRRRRTRSERLRGRRALLRRIGARRPADRRTGHFYYDGSRHDRSRDGRRCDRRERQRRRRHGYRRRSRGSGRRLGRLPGKRRIRAKRHRKRRRHQRGREGARRDPATRRRPRRREGPCPGARSRAGIPSSCGRSRPGSSPASAGISAGMRRRWRRIPGVTAEGGRRSYLPQAPSTLRDGFPEKLIPFGKIMGASGRGCAPRGHGCAGGGRGCTLGGH